MLPILVASQIADGVRSFLKTAFPVATPGIRRSEMTTLVDEFPGNRGRLFSKVPGWKSSCHFAPQAPAMRCRFPTTKWVSCHYQHQVRAFQRYLVVDELHTFDGAQGIDLAYLIRRLRDKLDAGEELACVGTSATIGDGSAVADLRAYAGQVN